MLHDDRKTQNFKGAEFLVRDHYRDLPDKAILGSDSAWTSEGGADGKEDSNCCP